jgi:hypothetical protein
MPGKRRVLGPFEVEDSFGKKWWWLRRGTHPPLPIVDAEELSQLLQLLESVQDESRKRKARR